jgi:hypothetical protein
MTHFKHRFNIGTRLHIVGLLPNFGSIDEIRDQRSLRSLLTLKEEEAKASGFHFKGNVANWNAAADPNTEFALTPSQAATLLAALRLASDERKLPSTDEIIELYEALEGYVATDADTDTNSPQPTKG